jgi:glycerol-3-phosphate acyltransferase PlsX
VGIGEKEMKIILDGMGGDKAPDEIVKGAVEAAREISEKIIIIGDEHRLKSVLESYEKVPENISVFHCSQVIQNDEAPVKAIRSKKDSSIVKGLRMVKEGEGDVFISAGNSGALLAGGHLILGKISGIDRPTLATIFPVLGGGQPFLLTDAGANAECKPINLMEFAIMGKIYMEKVMGRTNPKVGLVNNGTEKEKGTSLTKAAYALLEESSLNFIGNVEARDLPSGITDIAVTDGFTGNALLKMSEGMGLAISGEIKKMFIADSSSKFAAFILRNKLRKLKKSLSYTEYGGAPILGVKGSLLKMHGSSDSVAVKQTILKAIPYVEGKVVDIIKDSVSQIQNSKIDTDGIKKESSSAN